MSYQNLVAEKNASKEKEKGKRGRKRKHTASETDGTKAFTLKKKRFSEALVLQHPQSVPVAKMY